MSDSERHDGGGTGSNSGTSSEAGAAEDRAVAASEHRANFLGFVAHEMRNPLSTALWSAELLVRLPVADRGGPRGEKLAAMCLRSLQRLRHLVEDHFLSERLEVDGIPMRVEAVPLQPLAETVVAKTHAEQVTASVGDGLAAWADRGLLERALDGLVAVAAKGPVPVRVEGVQRDDRVELRVHGATPEPDALEPPRKGTASDPTGHALSLHMAARVARRLGGSVSALPDGYCLSLPLAPAAAMSTGDLG